MTRRGSSAGSCRRPGPPWRRPIRFWLVLLGAVGLGCSASGTMEAADLPATHCGSLAALAGPLGPSCAARGLLEVIFKFRFLAFHGVAVTFLVPAPCRLFLDPAAMFRRQFAQHAGRSLRQAPLANTDNHGGNGRDNRQRRPSNSQSRLPFRQHEGRALRIPPALSRHRELSATKLRRELSTSL
jgi:hypothetical protein